ncbi:MAG: PD40 domain-containing protein [Deltaproteobacteria bacterium]|nr:PD40 domain-containing protein [Deltaproteobacteria bacterium]
MVCTPEAAAGRRDEMLVRSSRRPFVRLIVTVGILALVQATAARAGDPHLKWRTLTTRHFIIHYYRRERSVALRLAVVAERVHKKLKPLLKWTLRRKTHIVLSDDTDSANGLAQIVPRNVVRLYATAPEDIETLTDYDDWLTELFTHEYTHILHLSIRGGVSDVINAIFGLGRGLLYTPNLIQPRWFVEGMAVLDETVRTTGGRIRSSLFRMMLRAAVLEHKTLSIAQISSNTIVYPHGRAAYLYGAFFLHYLYQKFGWRALVGISYDYGSQPIPFGLNVVARRHLKGQDYVSAYRHWMTRLQRKAHLTLQFVTRRGLRQGTAITRSGESTSSPRSSPTNDLVAYVESDGHSERSLTLYDLKTKRSKRITRVEGGTTLAWHPDGRRIFLSQPESYKAVYSYRDLFVWDLNRRRLKRLTRGLRAADVDVSPDGTTLAFSVNGNGRRCLATMPSGGGPVTTLWCGASQDQVYTPAFSPDGRTIAFSAWTAGGFRDLYLYDLATHKTRPVTHDRALDTGPTWSPDGRYLFFSSDRTGIFDIYALRLADNALFMVTNLATGAFQPTVSRDGKTLVYLGFHASGFDLYRMPIDPSRWLKAQPFVRLRPIPDWRRNRADHQKHPSPKTQGRPHGKTQGTMQEKTQGTMQGKTQERAQGKTQDWRKVVLSDKTYNPLWTLAPETWWASYDSSSRNLSLVLNGNDVVGYHSWALTTNYAIGSKNWSIGAAYNYSQLWAGLHCGFSHSEYEADNWKIDGNPTAYIAMTSTFNLGTDLPILRSYRYGSGTLRLRYRFQHRSCRSCPTAPLDPGQTIPQPPPFYRLSGFSASWTYSKIRGYTYSVSPEKGHSMAITASAYNPQIGSDSTLTTLTWRWTEYVPMPYLRHHVLVLRITGGIGWGDASNRTLFAIGGFGQQDYISALIDQTMVVGASLRGYAPNVAVGDHYYLLNAEYRFPICWIDWAPWTLPLFFRRLWGTVFTDWGHAFFGDITTDTLHESRVGTGAELLFELVMGYELPLTLRFGYAYGFGTKGGHRYYIFFGIPLG